MPDHHLRRSHVCYIIDKFQLNLPHKYFRGVGSRAAELSPQINLTTHVDELVALLETRDLRNVVIAAHSYGANVMTGAADRVAARVRALIYIDGPLPIETEEFAVNHNFGILTLDNAHQSTMSRLSLHGSGNLPEEIRDAVRGMATGEGCDGWKVPPFPAQMLGIPDDSPDAALVENSCTHHPLAALEEAVK